MASASDIPPEEMKAFLQEAEEQLQLLDETIIGLEKEADAAPLIQEIFRAVHTLKGTSGMLGFQAMADLAHAMEDLLDRLRKGTLTTSPHLVDALLAGLDGLKALKEALASPQREGPAVEPLLARLRAAAAGEGADDGAAPPQPTLEEALAADGMARARLQAALAAGRKAYRVSVEMDPESPWLAVRALQVLQELSARGEVILSLPSQQEIEAEKTSPRLQAAVASGSGPQELRAALQTVGEVRTVTVEPWAPAPASPREQPEAAAPRVEAFQSVRIDVERLDALMNMVGELAIDRTRISQISRTLQSRHEEDPLVHALGETAAHIEKVVDELQESMMQTRMLPIGLLFGKFPRLVRDLARSMGKRVDLLVEGEETEIDRSVIEKIKDPLVHLIRNAVDHGIEPPEERRAAGKGETGLIVLAAYHQQGQIVITLEDDGRGIDCRKVLEAAVRKGLLSAEAAERLSDSEALDLIFQPGFSTAAKTTEVSGRGVGMDVVRRHIEALNGLIEVSTHVGRGTRFTLRLPLTLATFRGLLVEAAKTVYAIPLSYVQEAVRPEAGAISTILGRPVMNLRGQVMPLLRLSSVCRIGQGEEDPQGEVEHVVVVNAGDRPVAIAVDALREQQEIVVKPLGSHLGQTRGVAGASILGDGQVVLILDVATLIKAA